MPILDELKCCTCSTINSSSKYQLLLVSQRLIAQAVHTLSRPQNSPDRTANRPSIIKSIQGNDERTRDKSLQGFTVCNCI